MSTNTLQQGQNRPLLPGQVTIAIDWPRAAGTLDLSAYILGANGKVRSDADMVFFNQRQGAGGAVALATNNDTDASFTIDPARLPADVERIVLCAAVDDNHPAAVTLNRHAGMSIMVNAGGEATAFAPALTQASERAMRLIEIYRHNSGFKVRAIAQGFNSGLAPLARTFGVDVEQPAAPAPTPAQPPVSTGAPVNLAKKLVSLGKKDPGLVSLVKNVGVNLAKNGLSGQRAKVALCLDISGSMSSHYRSGKIDRLVRRVLALSLQLDDDGAIDIFLFGTNAHYYGQVGIDNYQSFTADMQRRHSLEPGTYYGLVMGEIRAHYKRQPDAGQIPVFVLFLTDGGTQDVRRSETEIVEASREPIFWQFIAIGEMPRRTGSITRKNSRVLPRGFDFLQHLDKMSGRVVDNANFFAVQDPDDPSDNELFEMLMSEYPLWLKATKSAGILR